MMFASATMLFVPHSGKPPSKLPHDRVALGRSHSVGEDVRLRIEPSVTVTTAFRLPRTAFDHLIDEAAARHGLAPALIRAVIATESAFDPLAVSSAGAQGLMQLMPALSDELGVTDPFDPRENIMAGSEYLSALLATYDGDLSLALAGYNAGPGAVELYQGVPPFPETQRYVKNITQLVAQALPE